MASQVLDCRPGCKSQVLTRPRHSWSLAETTGGWWEGYSDQLDCLILPAAFPLFYCSAPFLLLTPPTGCGVPRHDGGWALHLLFLLTAPSPASCSVRLPHSTSTKPHLIHDSSVQKHLSWRWRRSGHIGPVLLWLSDGTRDFAQAPQNPAPLSNVWAQVLFM